MLTHETIAPTLPAPLLAEGGGFAVLSIQTALDLVRNVARVRRLPDVDLAYLAHILLAEAGLHGAFAALVRGASLTIRTAAVVNRIDFSRASDEARLAWARASHVVRTVRPDLELDVMTVVRPSVRLSSDLDGYREGAELDLAQYHRLRRNEVAPHVMWTEWLEDQLGKVGATLVDVSFDGPRRIQLVRQTQNPRERIARMLPVEAVCARLRLRFPDLATRDAALARGIGRHRTVGLGFLDPLLSLEDVAGTEMRWSAWSLAEAVS